MHSIFDASYASNVSDNCSWTNHGAWLGRINRRGVSDEGAGHAVLGHAFGAGIGDIDAVGAGIDVLSLKSDSNCLTMLPISTNFSFTVRSSSSACRARLATGESPREVGNTMALRLNQTINCLHSELHVTRH